MQAILAINLLVLVHEAGHLLVAKAFRVHSLRFSIGLGPRIFGRSIKGTDYCVSAVPIGGFVQLAHGHTHDDRTACIDCVSPWKRILIFFAGPAANFLFVIFLFWLVYSVIGYRDHQPVIASVEPGSREAIAGIEPGDRILEVDGRRVITWSQVALALEREGEDPVTLGIRRAESPEGTASEAASVTRLLTVLPHGSHALGIRPTDQMIHLRLGPFRALEKSFSKLWLLSGLMVDSLVGLATSEIPPSELVGPVYLFHLSSKAASSGPASLVYLLAFVSASLCFFNLLPLPVLDGGQILLTFLQRVLKMRIGARSLRLLMHASFFWLFLLLASATLNDLVRLLAS
jgi:regulator of sigma E protease